MTPDCAYILDSGRQCRGPVLHGQRFCRHHAGVSRPSATAAPAESAESPEPSLNRKEILRAYWRVLHHDTASSTEEEFLEDSMDMVIGALGTREICHRSAGRLIAAVLDRRAQLRSEAQLGALRQFQQQLQQKRQAGQGPQQLPHLRQQPAARPA